jgi:hypothetical protein
VDLSGFVDTYISHNFNFNQSDPQINIGRNYDLTAGAPELNMAGLSVSRDAAPIGFHIDLGLGPGYRLIHAADASHGWSRYLPQAFVAVRPFKGHDFQSDFGKFLANAGYESPETQNNWNYSRSLLFTYLCPNYHTGLRVTRTVRPGISAGAYLVNGWNTFRDNNSSKTAGLMLSVQKGRFTCANNLISGAERPADDRFRRTLYDTTPSVQASRRVSAYLNYDDLRDESPEGRARAHGVASGVRWSVNSRLSFATRAEQLRDLDGLFTGAVQRLHEVTCTADFRPDPHVLFRMEYRRDFSNEKIFRAADASEVRQQSTVLLGLILTSARAGEK